MQKSFAGLLASAGWFAVIAQYILMLHNNVNTVEEATIRFFSYFTILTNIAVAIYFTTLLFDGRITRVKGLLSAITVYIVIVGLVYQVALRHIWDPQGLQKWVDELLHSVIPLGALVYWSLFEKKGIRYTQIFAWSIYPLAYLLFTLIRGNSSGFYPYPFLNVKEIGMQQTLMNALIILALFMAISFIFVFINRKIGK
ncbi:Pr6Pr family membrane protein [Niabella yanshanensis]|uniref:Pr6Pr family membrane protein n=1 Tax=Niabella yanshanensis TaxID=577386 RepID=A0ABZ0W6X0_9BACT|nr:Pr6Pr family membrane protein [Niabella yanshanensis]WQD37277.1 Pr6Pr family membrane protein [Niabella yanshanensis]